MDLLFEKSVMDRRSELLPPLDVPETALPEQLARKTAPLLPELSEGDLSRHYSALEKRAYGVNSGFYPLGSCTMKYNPAVNEKCAKLPGFCEIHPLQPESSVQGCLAALALAEEYLTEITGMDRMTFQPAAGAQGEFTGLMLIKKYHEARGDHRRKKIIIPDSAHGTNPATVSMCGMEVVNIPSDEDGCINIERLKAAVSADTAGMMLTNPNTLGIFEKDILSITEIVHEAGGLVYYDGANLNAVMGVVRPGDMGFDIIHLNLHKTFSTPHGGGGPGCGAVGCKNFLEPYLPYPVVTKTDNGFRLDYDRPDSIGRVKGYYGNFLVVVKALAYLMTLGKEGIPLSAKTAVLNANYFMHLLKKRYTVATTGVCMHEFVISMEREKKERGVTATEIAKALIDRNIHPPTVYFPLIVKEALMVEPVETESKETLDEAARVFAEIYDAAMEDPGAVHACPQTTPIGRPDEVAAARNPVLRYRREDNDGA
ncbi:MAG: aminomethyl-transferring glycine dehydrogenase subunit GcvPB [Clostridiales Family XIII bacterium]|jgi:glycine dehydrogenase subunit 2|nr:aminomethyl-transferring glycine dehydrogenase subunit GcvPB [Clostridiales Family XIII bacterium]